MNSDRRRFCKAALGSTIAMTATSKIVIAGQLFGTKPIDSSLIKKNVHYKRIATEEAFIIPEMVQAYMDIIKKGLPDEPGFMRMWGNVKPDSGFIPKLMDIGAGRISDMDALGTDMQVLSLTAPGVQVFDPETAISLARLANDTQADAIAKNPKRFTGIATIPPQAPAAAAKELERAINELGLKGAVINSHTRGEYLDQPGFWEIFEAAESLDAPIYIHPRTPAPNILEPYAERGFEMAFHGFQAEVGLHILSIITAGVFDRFPGLKLVIGHLGEGLPYYLYRMDYMQWHTERPGLRGNKEPLKLKKKISDYMKENIYITTSGMPWPPAIKFAVEVLGPDRVLYAMDYPYEIEANEVKMMDDMDISDELKKKIFQTNAERVFKLVSSI